LQRGDFKARRRAPNGVPALGRANFGEEKFVTVMFLDVRGSTRLAEHRLPFDVVFLMSHFFAEMATAVENAGMAVELETPLAIGIGIHTGDAIVGRTVRGNPAQGPQHESASRRVRPGRAGALPNT
jgi:class 3 adenylate cyclase